MASDPLAPEHLFEHVKDAEYFHVPHAIKADGKIHIPQPFKLDKEIHLSVGIPAIDDNLEPVDFAITKFMVLEVVAALLLVVVFVGLANKMKSGHKPVGRMWNFLEAFLLFFRDDVARPAIGKKDADRFLPYLWSVFFFILVLNLLGMVPWLGSATGAFATTAAMAFITFLVVCVAGIQKMGPIGFLKNQVPHMDLPKPLAVLLVPMIFAIELLGLIIKHFVLAVRLMANIMAGHLVLATIVAFIAVAAQSMLWYGVMPASVLGATALSLLELFVAFLQAFIFTYLSALFIGAAIHSH